MKRNTLIKIGWMVAFFQILLFRYNCSKHFFNNLSYVRIQQRSASFRKSK